MSEVKLYTREMCGTCKTAKVMLKNAGIEYDELLVTDIEIDALIEKKFYHLPVIQINDDLYDGSVPSKVREFIKIYKGD